MNEHEITSRKPAGADYCMVMHTTGHGYSHVTMNVDRQGRDRDFDGHAYSSHGDLDALNEAMSDAIRKADLWLATLLR